MILTKSVMVYGNPYNINIYKKLGYDIKYGEYTQVEVKDLCSGYGGDIEIKCDYCGNIFKRKYSTYFRCLNLSPIKKDSCPSCSGIKQKESLMLLYGEDNPMKVESVKKKIKESFLEKYGVDNPSKCPEIKRKAEQTNLKKYGCKSPAQNEEVLQKIQETNIEKYGFITPLKNDEIKQKSKSTIIEKYGVEYVMQNEDIKNHMKSTCLKEYGAEFIGKSKEITQKRKNTNIKKYGFECSLQNEYVKQKSKNTLKKKYGIDYIMQDENIRQKALETKKQKYGVNSVMCSSQQFYIANLYGGEINYPMFGYFADIMFLDYKIFCEYSGSGHFLNVKYGSLTMEEFMEKEEIRRNKFLKNGFKEFEIISSTDILPTDEELLLVKEKAFNILSMDVNSYYGYNLDTKEEIYK